jgi:O-acetyl-ADP-ribose deacetylase
MFALGRRTITMAVIADADIPTVSRLYTLNKLTAPKPGTKVPSTLNGGPSRVSVPSKQLNDSIGLIRGDITTLAVDAIVNAANRSLLGGGGVDGAIHRAAGPGLLAECKTLGGCQTGSAKITAAYRLPCKKVIHAVGPVYDDLSPEKSEHDLSSCYTQSLELAAANGCRSVAFSALSTGVYGYPSTAAAPVAISAVKTLLEERQGVLDKVVFVTFEMKDVNAYAEFLP